MLLQPLYVHYRMAQAEVISLLQGVVGREIQIRIFLFLLGLKRVSRFEKGLEKGLEI